jgi:hypothetical protein
LTPHVIVANNNVRSNLANGICVDAQQSVRSCSAADIGGPTYTSYPNGDALCPTIPITPVRPAPQPETFDVNIHDTTVIIDHSPRNSSHYPRITGWAVGVDAAWWVDPAGGNLR